MEELKDRICEEKRRKSAMNEEVSLMIVLRKERLKGKLSIDLKTREHRISIDEMKGQHLMVIKYKCESQDRG